jgi:predicted Zn-ribbon and HTH transcriptional regulator
MAKFEIPLEVTITPKEIVDELLKRGDTIKKVVHGHWQKVNPMVDTVECSECGYQLLSEELKTPYCAWCGAEMDKET